MWIEPKVVDAKDLVPLTYLVKALQDMPIAQLEARVEALCAAQEAEHPGRRIRAHLEQARADGDLPKQAIRVAASIRELTVCALRPNTDSAYPLTSAAWSYAGSVHDTDRSIETGNFAIAAENLSSAEQEVAERPLLLLKKEADRLLRAGPPSEAALRRAGDRIVQEFQHENPGQVLKKRSFVEMFKQTLPGSNDAAALRSWRYCAPAPWRRPGVRLRGNRQVSDRQSNA